MPALHTHKPISEERMHAQSATLEAFRLSKAHE